MLIYHGTTSANQNDIINRGISPRDDNPSQWKEHPSRNDMVYLTDIYAPYFAINAVGDSNEDALIVEVNLDKLEESDLYPDEDFLEQSTRGQGPKGSIDKRTTWFRDHLLTFQEMWTVSLAHLGTLCYRGIVPVDAITRAVRIPFKGNEGLFIAVDPTITIINHKLCQDFYKTITETFMSKGVRIL